MSVQGVAMANALCRDLVSHAARRHAGGAMPARRCDLHVHTRYSSWTHLRAVGARDSYADPLEVFAIARAAGMDFVAITDHDSIEGALRLRDALPCEAHAVIIGEEVGTFLSEIGQWIHVNVFGVDEATHRDLQHLKPDAGELVAYLRARGLLHVLNHPFQSYHGRQPPRDYIERILDLFTHIEIGNGAMPASHAAAGASLLRFAARRGQPKIAVAGSDAHVAARAGASWTAALGETPDAWLQAVRRGDCMSSVRPVGFAAVFADVHRAVGCYYAEWLRPEGRRELQALNFAAGAALLPAAIAGVPAVVAIANRLRQDAGARRIMRELEAAPMGAPLTSPVPEKDPA
jgi:predicted metal-dependent phosphoesterase TrpH